MCTHYARFAVTKRNAMSITITDTIKIKADMALRDGESPKRSIETIFTGRVVFPGPITKKVTTNSSNDIVNANKAAPIIPGEMIGRVTLPKAPSFVAPRF